MKALRNAVHFCNRFVNSGFMIRCARLRLLQLSINRINECALCGYSSFQVTLGANTYEFGNTLAPRPLFGLRLCAFATISVRPIWQSTWSLVKVVIRYGIPLGRVIAQSWKYRLRGAGMNRYSYDLEYHKAT